MACRIRRIHKWQNLIVICVLFIIFGALIQWYSGGLSFLIMNMFFLNHPLYGRSPPSGLKSYRNMLLKGQYGSNYNSTAQPGEELRYKTEPPLQAIGIERRTVDFNIDRLFIPRLKEDANGVKATIPKTIHFMWTYEIIPSVFVGNVKSFMKNHKTWTFYFWNYPLARDFIADHYPDLLSVFDSYHLNVSKSDMIRILAIYHYGGVYFDLDTRSIKPLDDFVENETCVLSPEPREHAVIVLHTLSILNACAVMCIPKHALFKYIISLLHLPLEYRNPMLIAGPVFITEAVTLFVFEKDLNLTSNDAFHVVSSELFLDGIKADVHFSLHEKCEIETKGLISFMCRKWRNRGGISRQLSKKAYTSHMYHGSNRNLQELIYLKQNHYKKVIPNVKTYEK